MVEFAAFLYREGLNVQFNVAQLLKEPVGAVRDYDVSDWPNPPQDVDWIVPITGRARLMRTNRGILVRADLDGRIKVECGRCLEEAEAPVHLQIDDEYLPTVDVTTGVKLPPPDDEAAFLIDEHHTVDLSEAVRQYGVINQPFAAVCKEDCAGLCPTCGADLNLGPCACTPETADDRWTALKQLALEDARERSSSRGSAPKA